MTTRSGHPVKEARPGHHAHQTLPGGPSLDDAARLHACLHALEEIVCPRCGEGVVPIVGAAMEHQRMLVRCEGCSFTMMIDVPDECLCEEGTPDPRATPERQPTEE